MAISTLIVDDDRRVREEIRDGVDPYELAARCVGSDALNEISLKALAPEAIVINYRLFMRAAPLLRSEERAVIVYKECIKTVDSILALEIGADDAMSYPIHPRELQARVRAVWRARRARKEENAGFRPTPSRVLNLGPFVVDVNRREVEKDGAPLTLTAGEFDLLQAFAEHPYRVLSRELLLDLARGRKSGPFDRTIDVQVGRLRRKIGDDPRRPYLIQTVRNGGYIFIPDMEKHLSPAAP